MHRPWLRRLTLFIWMLLLLMLGCALFNWFVGAYDTAGADELERTADSVTVCTCVEGPLAVELERLRTQVRLLKAEKAVNAAVDCAAKRKGKKR